jgi:hypothetical protein
MSKLKLYITLIYIGLLANICMCEFLYQRPNNGLPNRRRELRRFGMGLGLLNAYKLQEILRIESDKKRQEKAKNEKILNAERRQIYERYLLKFQGATSVLRDFHTNRF